MRPYFCEDATPVFYNLFDFSIAPPLLYYAYIPILLLTLLFSAVALYSNNFDRNSKLLTGLSLSLAFFVFVTFLQWIAAPITVVMFSWELWNFAFALMYLFATLFIYSFVYDIPPSNRLMVLLLVFLLPIIIFMPTTLNVEWFDLSWCEGVLNELMLGYTYLYVLLAMAFIGWIGTKAFLHNTLTKLSQQQVLLTVGSALAFLFLFFATTFWGDLIDDYRVELIGPVGAVLFLAAMTYVSLNYQRFNIKLLATEVFVITLLVVVGSIIFVRTIEYVQIIAASSLILVVLLGWWLVRSVRKEVEQRKRIEELAKNLEKANARLKVLDKMKSEFVSIASHQLRSPLTAIRGYASMLLDGSYGKLSKKSTEAVERIADSSRYMALSVEDYLNVSRIEAGNMKYEIADFNLKEVTEKIVDEMRPAALKKGLLLIFRSDCDGSCSVHADIGKTRQVIMNLIDNSMKYTPKGGITVFAHDDVKKKKMYVSVKDTGVGMSKDTIEDVFDKFVRAKNANEVNVTGTGLGLYVAKKMVEEMGGKIWGESEGEEKGSIFHIELPLLPGKYKA